MKKYCGCTLKWLSEEAMIKVDLRRGRDYQFISEDKNRCTICGLYRWEIFSESAMAKWELGIALDNRKKEPKLGR
jgi:hypothetical protein